MQFLPDVQKVARARAPQHTRSVTAALFVAETSLILVKAHASGNLARIDRSALEKKCD